MAQLIDCNRHALTVSRITTEEGPTAVYDAQ